MFGRWFVIYYLINLFFYLFNPYWDFRAEGMQSEHKICNTIRCISCRESLVVFFPVSSPQLLLCIFDPSILRHSGIWGAADEAALNKVHKKSPCKIMQIQFTLKPRNLKYRTNFWVVELVKRKYRNHTCTCTSLYAFYDKFQRYSMGNSNSLVSKKLPLIMGVGGGVGGGRSPLPLTSHIFHWVPGVSAIRTLTWSKLKCFESGVVSSPPSSSRQLHGWRLSQIRLLLKKKVERIKGLGREMNNFLNASALLLKKCKF